MMEPHKPSYWQLEKKNSVNAFHGNEWMKENTLLMIYKADTPQRTPAKYDAKPLTVL